MRGKAIEQVRVLQDLGITPAYAGKSQYLTFGVPLLEDHPRLCGEKRVHPPEDFRQMGSPPPMRGKGEFVMPVISCKGITPAYAGKSCRRHVPAGNVGDHPRLCGEKHFDVVEVEIQFRITPAYAGKRCIPLYPWNRYKDNPRLCGEKSICRRSIFGYRGSPPPMRGKDRRKQRLGMQARITPAYAGKSS